MSAPRESRGHLCAIGSSRVIPAPRLRGDRVAGIQYPVTNAAGFPRPRERQCSDERCWIPAFAGMTHSLSRSRSRHYGVLSSVRLETEPPRVYTEPVSGG